MQHHRDAAAMQEPWVLVLVLPSWFLLTGRLPKYVSNSWKVDQLQAQHS
jgi:hypothetical protein